MPGQAIGAAGVKARCLALVHLLTKRGRPAARVPSVEPPRSLRGSVEYLVSDEELIEPLYPDWEPTLET
jgi:hypothetical protein